MANRATALKEHVGSEGLVLTNHNSIGFNYDSLAQAFPEVDPGMRPLGQMGVFQIRHPKRFTSGGIELPPDVRSTEYYNTQIAKVIALGPLCFKTSRVFEDHETGAKSEVLTDWAEGPWFKPGDFVRLPKYGGDRFSMPCDLIGFEVDPSNGRREKKTVKDEVIFALFKVSNVIGVITGDPLAVKSFLD